MTATRNPTLAAVAALLLAAGCKPAAGTSGADVKTLDNFTRDDGADIKNYFCGLSMSDKIFAQLSANDKKTIKTRVEVPGDDKALKYAVAGALAAVPKAMQLVFFAGKGKIRVVDDAQKVCKDAKLSDAERKFASENAKDDKGAFQYGGCWQIDAGHLEVILSKDPQSIQHGLLRLFTFVYTQFLTKGLEGDKVAAGFRTALKPGVDRFKKQRYELGVALLQDLSASSPAKAKTYEAFAEGDRDGYENMAFSEAVDSAYCTATTRAVFEKQFPKTYAAFTKADTGLLKDFGEPLY